MKRIRDAFLHSLAFKIGAVIVLAEMVVSALTGAFYLTHFNTEIDRRITDNVLRPAALMNQGLLKFEVIADEKRMSELVGEELINAFVIGLTGNIFYSLKNEYTGRSVSSVPQFDAGLLNPDLTRPLVYQKGPQGHIFALAPLFGADGRSLRFFVFLEASTAVAADQKRNNVWLFVLGALSTAALASIMIFVAFYLTIFTPLQHLLSALEQVEIGDFNTRLAAAEGRDELGHLARAFNRMAARSRQTMETLHRERDLLERITETSPVGITVVNRDGQVTFANAQSEKVLGLNKDTITQRTYNAPAWRITAGDGSPFPEEELPFRRVMSTRQPVFDAQHAIVWPEGHRVLLSINAAPVLDGAGEVASVVCTIEDITQRRQMEQERLAHLNFLENMDRVNRAIQENKDIEQMLSEVLDVVISVFECDRASLVYPCDPQAAAWQAIMERTRLEYPGAFEIPMDSGVAKVYQAVLASNDPVAFGTGNEYPLPTDVAGRFPEHLRPASQLATAIQPREDKPYLFVIHQCARPRIWTKEKRRLFKEVGRRLEDALTSLLMYRNLQDSETRYRQVFENSPVSIWEEDFSAVKAILDDLKKQGVTDIETWFDRHPEMVRQCAASVRIIDVNQAALVFHGAANKQELLTGLVNTFTPASFDTFRQELVCLWRGGAGMSGDAVVKTLAGEPRYVTVYFSVFPDHEQTLTKVLVSLIDITERKQIEKALSASEAELRTLINAMTDVIFVCNSEGRYLKIVDTSPSLLYKPPKELWGKTLHEVFPRDLADFFLDHVRHALEAQQPINFEYRLPVEMKEFWFHATISPLNADEILMVARDITDRKHAEEKLQESEERLRLTMEATQIGIFDWDVVHDIWYASSEYYFMLGYEPKNGRGDRQEWLERVHPDDRSHVEAKIREVLARTPAAEQLQPYEYEARMRHADGCYRWEHVKGFGVRRNHQGRVTRLLGIRMDITDRKKAEESLHRLNLELDQRVLERTAQLEAANKELEAFAYSVSHDLRAPLRHIDGFLELLEKRAGTALDEQSRYYMKAISEAARKMGRLIDDLLSFSRMGRHALYFKKVMLKNLVLDVVRELEPDTAGRNIDWHIGDLPMVSGDAAMLRMVLSNLISNALKFTRPRQQARIEIEALPGQDPETVICVRDNGVGFDMTYADKLFGVFQRLHRADEFEGTGIGLANVRRIINRHGGRTWAESEVDRGAAFFFSLRRAL